MGASDSTQVPPPVATEDTRTDAEKLAAAQAELAALRSGDATEEAAEATVVETDAEKIRRLENELAAGRVVTQVPASGAAPGITDPAIDLAGIEPGIKWAIRNGLVDPASFGDHIAKAFEAGEL